MENNEFVEKKSKKKVLIIALVGILLLIIGLGSGAYFYVKDRANPKAYLEKTSEKITQYVDTLFSKVDEYAIKDQKSDSKSIYNLSFNTDNEDLSMLNNYSINFDIISSIEKEEMQMNMIFFEGIESILKGNLSLTSDAIYLTSEDLYDKTLKVSSLEENIFSYLNESSTNEYSLSAVKNSLSNFINSFFLALEESEAKSEIVDVYKVKYLFEINDTNLDKVSAKFEELVKNDKLLTNILASDSENSFEIVPMKIEVIENVITKEFYSLIFSTDNYNLSITKDENENNNYLVEENDTTGNLKIEDEKIVLNFYDNEELDKTYEIIIKDEEFGLIYTDSEGTLNLTAKKTSTDTIIFKFILEDESTDEKISIALSGTCKLISNGFELTLFSDINIGSEKISMTLKGETLTGDELLTKGDYKDSVLVDDLSETETNSITNKLITILSQTKIMESILGNSNL